jgi:acyl-CoA hydrolase
VSFFTRTVRVGNTSVTVDVLVEAERGHPGGPKVKVTEAEVVFRARREGWAASAHHLRPSIRHRSKRRADEEPSSGRCFS